MSSLFLSLLANHLWQSSLFAGIAGLLTLALGNNRARVRHWVWLAASWKFLIPCFAIMSLGGHIHWRTAPQTTTPSLLVVADEVSQPFTAPAASPASIAAALPSASAIPVVLWTIWACGFLGIGGSWWIRWRGLRAAVRAGSPLHLEMPIRAVTSRTLLEPGVFGVFRPVLLLPEGILDRLTPEQLEGVIAHELCHVSHRDNLLAAIHMFVETVFWFHPLVWWIGKRMVEERERACDEEVLSLGSDPRVYAQGILNVCKLYTESPLACTCGITGSDLTQRIAAIAANRAGARLSPIKKVSLGIVASSALVIPFVFGIVRAPALSAQSSSSSAGTPVASFEVASVKPCKDDGGSGGRGGGGGGTANSSPGRLDLPCQPVRGLIRIAYIRANFRITGEDNLQMEGGPAWLDAKRYSIVAKAEGPAPIEVMEGPMLQRLLEDRFGLITHRETREASVYALSVAKGGLKIKPAAPGSCTARDPSDTDFVAPVAGQQPFCGEASMAMNPYRFKFTLASGTLRQLASNLGSRVGRPVLDKTGIEGKFDFHLEFAPNGADPSDERTAPSVFSALAEMGLRLETAKGQRNYLVIDHVEAPTGN